MKTAHIFTEAGEGIGLGHLVRCQALAHAFKESGGASRLFVNLHGWPGFKLESGEILDWANTPPETTGADMAIFDSYLGTRDVFHSLAGKYRFSAALDDYNRIVYPVNLVVNPNIYGDRLDYSNQTAKVLGGPEYVILRQEFIAAAKKNTTRDEIRDILITMGGSDYRNLIPRIIEALRPLSEKRLQILAGTDAYAEHLKGTLPAENIVIHGKLGAADLAALMQQCDLAITAAGQSLNELAHLGIPAIAICVDKDQENNIKAFHESGLLQNILHWDQENKAEIMKAAVKNLESPEQRRSMTIIGKKLINSNGALIIARYMKTYDS